MNTQQPTLDVHEKPSGKTWAALSFQHLFAMFGATVLVPMLVGLDPSIALLSGGVGTLAYLLCTKGKIPAYLGSSFAFIAPMSFIIANEGVGAAMMGGLVVGIVYLLVSLGIKVAGSGWLIALLPPIVVGPVIMVIGLGLAGTAVGMAMYENPGAPQADLIYSGKHILVAGITLAAAVGCSLITKGFLQFIPILVAIVVGYVTSIFVGLVDFSVVTAAPWFALPNVTIPFIHYAPSISWDIVLLMVPVALVTFAEHTGHQMVLSKVVGRNFLHKPGLHRSIFGDGLATIIASFLGGPPNTTYGENIGVLAITRIYSVFVLGGAAVLAISFAFIGKISAFLTTIPTAVMGGVSILLFGIIATSGLRMMIDNKVDMSEKRNLIIPSCILVIGIGGAFVQFTENFTLQGMALAAIVGIILNLILPGREVPKKEEMFEASTKKAA